MLLTQRHDNELLGNPWGCFVKKLFFLLVTILCVSLAGVQPAVAQEIALVGTIQDEPGGALPGVTVTARHLSTGNTFLGVTDATGIYRIGASASRSSFGVSNSIHLAHPALANEGGDVVMAESGADFECHGLSG